MIMKTHLRVKKATITGVTANQTCSSPPELKVFLRVRMDRRTGAVMLTCLSGSVQCVCVQIKEKLLQLTDKRKEMIDKWEDRWEWLRLSKIYTLPV